MRTFPVKHGSCHIFPDWIEIRQSGFLIGLANQLGGRKLFFNLLVTLLMALGLGIALLIQNYLLASFLGAMTAFYAFLSWNQRNISLSRRILRSQIESVFFTEAIPGQTRASFTIWYNTSKGMKLQRALLLPTQSEQDNMVVQSAIQIMREEKLLSN